METVENLETQQVELDDVIIKNPNDDDINETNEIDDKDSGIHVTSDSAESLGITDPFANLPDNWSQLDFGRKKSCLLSHIYSTCVNKALNHLEALQNAIDDWITKASNETQTFSRIPSNSAKRVTELVRTKSSSPVVKKVELKFSLPPTIHSANKSNDNQLAVVGLGARADQSKPANMVIEERHEPYENLYADGVLEEVLVILARLEYDRRRSEALLSQEKQNVVLLKNRIERWGLKRINELPVMVQKEHEACIADITELHWHIAFHSKSEKKLRHKVQVEEKFCAQLQEDIENINKSTPLIEEKCSLELKAIQKILTAQQETDEMLLKAREKYTEAFERNKVAHAKANKEIEALQADLANSKRELNKAKKRLLEANEAFKNLSRTLEETNKEMDSNNKQENFEIAKREKNREKNIDLSKENARIENERFKLKKDTDRVTFENQALQGKINILSKQYKEELDQLSDVLYKKQEKLEKIKKKIVEKQINIEEMERDYANIQYNIQKEERNRDRLLKDQEKNKEQLISITDSFARAQQINESVVNDLYKETKRYEQREENMKRQINEIKKQVSDERHSLSVLTARLQSEIEEYQNSIIDARMKKQQFEIRRDELENRLSDLEKTVKNIETRKSNTEQLIEKLKAGIAKTREDHVKVEIELNEKVKNLEPLKDEKTKLNEQKKQEWLNMQTHTADMQKKIEIMTESKAVMVKTIEKANEEIEELTTISDEINIQFESTKNLDTQMHTSLNQIMERNKNSEIGHIDHMKDRKTYLSNLQDSLKTALETNKEFAAKYRQLKYDTYMKKLELLLKIEKRLDVFSKVKDKRQLHALQVRMHNALEDYFNYQVEYIQHNYGKLNNEASKNSDKILTLEDSFNNSVDRITSFLKNQVDFSVVRQQAMQKVLKEELQAQQQQEKELQEKSQMSKQMKSKVNFNLESIVK